MNVRILAFASARDALGADELDFELPAESDLEALREGLIARHGELRELWPRLAIAIDGRLVHGNADLADGQEVALLPPVSGGQHQRAALVDGSLEVGAVTASVTSSSRGALVVFLGNVRDSHDGRGVERLSYSAYRPMASAALETIAGELSDESRDLEVAIHHRLGEVAAGETSVVIAAAAAHRDLAYTASREALERLKREVPIWKREHYADGESAWREEESLTEPQYRGTEGSTSRDQAAMPPVRLRASEKP